MRALLVPLVLCAACGAVAPSPRARPAAAELSVRVRTCGAASVARADGPGCVERMQPEPQHR